MLLLFYSYSHLIFLFFSLHHYFDQFLFFCIELCILFLFLFVSILTFVVHLFCFFSCLRVVLLLSFVSLVHECSCLLISSVASFSRICCLHYPLFLFVVTVKKAAQGTKTQTKRSPPKKKVHLSFVSIFFVFICFLFLCLSVSM